MRRPAAAGAQIAANSDGRRMECHIRDCENARENLAGGARHDDNTEGFFGLSLESNQKSWNFPSNRLAVQSDQPTPVPA
jgi:hypothetical protein